MELYKIFSSEGLLAQNLPYFEFRQLQLDMAESISIAIKTKTHILAEAGTGTGKSFAYLVPLILYSIKNNEAVVISTNTKSLQQQMLYKDLPFLLKIFKQISLKFSFKIFYGSNNYLCKNRREDFFKQGRFDFGVNKEIIEWIQNTDTGIKTESKIEIPENLWQRINRDPELCLRKKCRFYEECFYYMHHKELYNTNIIIINHHLFFANIANEYRILPMFKVFVLDEAHNIEDVAAQFFAENVSEYEFYLLLNIFNSFIQYFSEADIDFKIISEFSASIRDIRNKGETFFNYIRGIFSDTTRIREEHIFEIEFIIAIEKFFEYLKEFFKLKDILSEEHIEKIDLTLNKFSRFIDRLKFFIKHDTSEYVYWIEFYGIKRFCNLKYTPLNIAEILRRKVFQFYDCGILTSATLSTNENFEFIKNRAGIDECIEKIYPSPFDYKKQVLLYINREIPSPVDYKNYIKRICREINLILEATRGRAFILFTSYKTLMDVRGQISDKLEYRLLVQNEMPFHRIIGEFRKDINSVLLGTMSFWEGVDIPGESLSAVIITRLPFDMPEDPLISARIEKIRQHNGNPFYEYQLPNAAMLLKQGFGRLIRNRQDKGIVAILDSRILNKNYGKYFLNSLPECAITSNIDDIANFFNSDIQ